MSRTSTKPRASRPGPGRGGAREGAGRKPRGEAATPLYLRLTVEEREAYEMQARREGMSLLDWTRNTLALRVAAWGA